MLLLNALDPTKILGIYGASKTRFPRRMSYLHPNAAEHFLSVNHDSGGNIVLSDMYRTAAASLSARYPISKWLPRRSIQPPGYSAHNFGLAIDVAVSETLKRMNMTKSEFDFFMADHGWWCHRLDHLRGSEDWHYNYLGISHLHDKRDRRTAPAVERLIQQLYANEWNNIDVDECLDLCAMPDVKMFQRDWYLKVDGIVGPKTKRLLWLVSEEKKLKNFG